MEITISTEYWIFHANLTYMLEQVLHITFGIMMIINDMHILTIIH